MSINLILASILESVNRNMLGMKSSSPEEVFNSQSTNSKLFQHGNNRFIGFA